MSKALVDKLIKDFLTDPKYKRRWDTVLRSQMGGYAHITTITEADLVTLYRDNTIAAIYGEKSFKDAEVAASRVKGIEEAAVMAASHVYANFETYYARTHGKRKGSVVRDGNKIIVRQPNGLHSSVQRIIWQQGWKLLKTAPELSEQSRRRIGSAEGMKVMRRRTQNLHEEKTTVGSFTLSKLYERVMSNTINSDFTVAQTTVIANTIGEYFGAVTAVWKKDQAVGRYSVSDTLEIPLTIGPQSSNPTGSEAYDWKQIRGKLEQELFQHALQGKFGEQYASTGGSKPLTEKVTDRALHIVIEEIEASLKGKKSIKMSRTALPKEEKGKTKYSGKQSDNKKAKKAKRSKIKRNKYSVTTSKNQKTAMSPIALAALINAKLPDEVASKMGAPRLDNRSGRFASSARVTDVSITTQGFPSIGYTYRKDPYQVYEVGSGTRFSDSQRDPRPLIDASIRSIAAQFLTGRLYTRRI